MRTPHHAHHRRRASAAFTLTELMVAVVMLIAIMLAVGKIFQTTRDVTRLGEASADVLQETATIERLWREDIGRLSPEGVFLIRSIAIPNNLYDDDELLNPALSPFEYLRSDQLLFFTTGIEGSNVFRLGADANQKGQGTLSRIYYGHAFQLGQDVLPAREQPNWQAHDPYPTNDVMGPALYPWSRGNVRMAWTEYEGNSIFSSSGANNSEYQMPQADARKWVMVRQPILLVDDDRNPANDFSKTVYMQQILTARSIFLDDDVAGYNPQVMHGRVDAAATQLDDLRRNILYDGGLLRDWTVQRDIMRENLLYFPRAERFAPSPVRIDHALTTAVLGTAVSQIAIDWTWDEGVGETFDVGTGGFLNGFRTFSTVNDRERLDQVWFGMPQPGPFANTGATIPDVERGVGTLSFESGNHAQTGFTPPESVFGGGVNATLRNTIEDIYSFTPAGASEEIVVYEAFFGFNQTRSTRFSDQARNSYTPWPSAIRVTLTVHDNDTNLEFGREVQFVIDLDRRMPGGE